MHRQTWDYATHLYIKESIFPLLPFFLIFIVHVASSTLERGAPLLCYWHTDGPWTFSFLCSLYIFCYFCRPSNMYIKYSVVQLWMFLFDP